MPAPIKKAAARSPAPAPVSRPPAHPQRPVTYPELTVNGVPIPREKLKLSAAFLRDLLGFETESEYQSRCAASADPAEQAKGPAGFGNEYLLGSVELFGEKVRCWNNLDNRPFDPGTAEKYCQDAGDKNWAGYETMDGNAPVGFPLDPDLGGGTVSLPPFTVNGETIIVGRTGKVESGQHRAIGGILLAHRWHKDPARYPRWAEEPFIESLVVFGVSESPAVVRTLDNVRPRQLSDTVYTSDVFKWNADGTETGQRQRRDMSRMLDAATDLLWKRTGAGFAGKAQTHSTSFDFIDRHERLKDAVRFVFDRNEDRETYRGISLLQLSPGQVAAAMYLMGCCRSDAARYAGDRSERVLGFTDWAKAEQFVCGLAACKDRSFKAVKAALGALKSVEDGMGGRAVEKLAVLSLAWARFRAGEEVRESDLELHYGVDRGGNPCLLDPPTFGGIDLGPDPTPPETLTPAQVEREKARVRQQKAEQAQKAAAGAGGGTPAAAITAQLDELRAEWPGRVLFFRNEAGNYNMFQADAELGIREWVLPRNRRTDGLLSVTLPKDRFEEAVGLILGRGGKAAVVASGPAGVTVTEVRKRAAPRPGKPGARPAAAGAAAPKAAPAAPAGPKAAPAAPAAGGPKLKRKGPVLRGGTGS